MKGGSSRKPMVMWNFSGTPGGGTWLSPGQTMSWPTSLIVFLCNELSFSPDVHFVWQNYKLVIFLYFWFICSPRQVQTMSWSMWLFYNMQNFGQIVVVVLDPSASYWRNNFSANFGSLHWPQVNSSKHLKGQLWPRVCHIFVYSCPAPPPPYAQTVFRPDDLV